MTKEDKILYLQLKSKLMERLNSKKIIPNDEIVSIKDVKDASRIMIPYNKILLEDANKEIDSINKKNGFLKANTSKPFRDHLFIKSIDIALDGNGICNIFVYCIDENNNKGIVRYTADLYQELGLEYKVNIAMSEENESKISHINFPKYFRAAKAFADEFPDVPYIWSQNLDNVYNQHIGDGFIESIVDLNHPNWYGVILKDEKDLALATTKIDHGYLDQDYFGMYGREMSERTTVNMNDLNPFLRLLTKKHLGLEEEFTLKRQ